MNNRYRKCLIAMGLALTLSLTGCTESYPEKAADGTEWNKDWTILGTTLGVEEPDNGLTLSENPVVLSGDDMYYATWTYGDSVAYTNSDGDDTDLYDAELYLLLYGCGTVEAAETNVREWIEKEEDTYNVTSTDQVTINEQEYTILTYTVDSDTNPYSRGVSAFGVYGMKGISAELSCTEDADVDEYEMLMEFLAGCHYNAADEDE